MKSYFHLFFCSCNNSNLCPELRLNMYSAQISIDSPYVITNAAPSSYSISGSNITTSTGTGDNVVTNAIGGLNLGSFDNNGTPNAIHTNKTVTTAGSSFSLSESYQAGDGTQTAITPSSGIATLPILGGQTTVILEVLLET